MINRVLKNGIRVAVVPLEGLRSITIEVSLKIGAKYEEANEHGLSHFLEHMAFKGTIKRPKPTDIFREMDVRGADFNAETGLENTSYSITTVRNNLEWGLEMMSDILFNSTFPQIEVEKERGVICEEIKMYKDNPMMGLGSEMMNQVYGKTEIGCWNISGKIEQIEKINREEIINFKNKYFNTSQLVIVLAGNVKEADLKTIEKYFNVDKTTNELKIIRPVLNKVKIKQEIREVEQGHIAMAVPTTGWVNDENRYVLRLLDIIMTGNSSSYLFEEIRSKRGWAYYVFSISEMIKEAGVWGVQVGVSLNNLSQTIDLIKEMMSNAHNLITQDDLERAKTYLNGKIELHLDQSEFWSGYMADKWLLEDKLITPTDELKKFERVAIDQIKEVSKSIFGQENTYQITVLAK